MRETFLILGVADIARLAGVKELLPIHIHPTLKTRQIKTLVGQMQRQVGTGCRVVYPTEARAIDMC